MDTEKESESQPGRGQDSLLERERDSRSSCRALSINAPVSEPLSPGCYSDTAVDDGRDVTCVLTW